MTDKYRPLKDAFGRFVTGIVVATCKDADGKLIAITVNSFTSVSLEPPLVLWCLDNRASTYSAFMGSDSYGISILRADQRTESDRFARYAGPPVTEAEVEYWNSGSPILKDRLAGFDCKVVARHDAGDHVILVGEVTKFDSAEGEPLIYFASNYIPDSE